MRLLLSAGGTAGHVLPALTVLKYLETMSEPISSVGTSSSHQHLVEGLLNQGVQALFVGEVEGMAQELVTREGVEFYGIPAGALHGVDLVHKLLGGLKLAAGSVAAFAVLARFKPDVVLLTGGFVGVPISIAAWLQRVPAVVYLPDIEPGMALKVMAKMAVKVATTTESSAQFIGRSKMVVTGYPVRDAFFRVTREAARSHFDIAPDEKLLLVFGGSKGARSINRAITRNLAALLSTPRVRIMHITGKTDWEEISRVRAGLTASDQARYCTYAYLHEEMADAMAAADLALCRSGASTLGELPLLGLPAVLVPYPYAWRYQKVNAQYLVDRGAAVMMEDGKLDRDVVHTVQELLGHTERLNSMRRALMELGGRNGARAIAELLATVSTTTRLVA